MQSFKEHLLNEFANVKPVETEAMLLLQKIIDMSDDGHVDYSPKAIKINVGRLTKNKKYNGLNIYIIRGTGSPKLGRHNDEESHAIFLYSTKLPNRENIDTFLSHQERSSAFKRLFTKFYNDAVFDDREDEEGTEYEQASELNTRPAFEKAYVDLVNKLNDMLDGYTIAKKELDDRIENANADLGHKAALELGVDKLKKDMVGENPNSFKAKAIELFGKDRYKLLDKEYRTKLDSRLTDYYEHKFKK
jgi:hypothetical protein